MEVLVINTKKNMKKITIKLGQEGNKKISKGIELSRKITEAQ